MDVLKRLQQRVHENIAESTRDLDFGTSVRMVDAPNDKLTDIMPKLASSNEQEVVEAMKRVLVLLSHNRDLSTLFPSIVKLVSARNLRIKILAYVYLSRYAQVVPELAMLSVNTFQKDSTHPSPLVRAQSIRVLSSISSEDVAPICLLCVKRAANDPNPYVRRASALAISKCYDIDASLYDDLKDLALELMKSSSSIPIGSAAYAFVKIHSETEVLNQNLAALHAVFRHLVRHLADCEEWSQLVVLDLLSRYSRVFLPQPVNDASIDKDLEAFLSACQYLQSSSNPAVAATASKSLLALGPASMRSRAFKCLLRLRKSSPEVAIYVMLTLQHISEQDPASLAPFYLSLYLLRKDDRQTKAIKLRILRNVFPHLNNAQQKSLTKELTQHTLDPDTDFATEALETLGDIPRRAQGVSDLVHRTLAESSTAADRQLSQQSIIQLQNFVSDRETDSRTLRKLLRRMFEDVIIDDEARAALVWMSSISVQNPPHDELVEYSDTTIWKYGPDILRKCAKGFMEEGSQTQIQIVHLASVMITSMPGVEHIQALARRVLRQSLALSADADKLESHDALNRRRTNANTVAGLFGEQKDSDSQTPSVLLRSNQAQAVLTIRPSSLDQDEEDISKAWSENSTLVAHQGDILASDLPEWSTEHTDTSQARNDAFAPAPEPLPVKAHDEVANYNIPDEAHLPDIRHEAVEVVDAESESTDDDDLEKFLGSDSD